MRHGPGGFGATGFGARRSAPSSAALASYLDITPAQLRTELLSGKTLAQIAVAHNKTADGVVATLLGEAKKKLDAAVTAGKLPAAKEQAFLDQLKTLLTAVVNGKMPSPSAFGFGGSHMAPQRSHALERFGGFSFGPAAVERAHRVRERSDRPILARRATESPATITRPRPSRGSVGRPLRARGCRRARRAGASVIACRRWAWLVASPGTRSSTSITRWNRSRSFSITMSNGVVVVPSSL